MLPCVYILEDTYSVHDTYCGYNVPSAVTFNSERIQLHFFTNNQITAQGFQITLTAAANEREYVSI